MLPSSQPMEIQVWPVERLVFYARNPRKNDSAVDRMCSSIREFGFKIPVLARSDGEVVDGHLRLKAARKLGITEVPVAAAELTERICYGLELDPKYVDVIVQRWQQLTGKKAKLAADGRTFEEISQERQKEADESGVAAGR